ncbi:MULTISPECIES: hypothetical protein [unclassified Microbacterium]|uniref:hypothetical protein n=1 Tax=unclassified Microbacterium TaxID=2609290 RepID=UPI000C2C46CB|nr:MULTISPECIES: hypothetical protein [unclassified Microbacterium]
MGSRVPGTQSFGRQNEERDQLRRGVQDALRVDGAQYAQLYARFQELVAQSVLPAEVFEVDHAPAITATIGAEFATVTTPVPDGYTRALVSITATVRVRNSGSAGSWADLNLSPRIQGVVQITNWGSIDGTRTGTVSASCTEVLEGLAPGDDVSVSASASFPVAYTLGQVSVAGSILFLR